MANVYIGGFPVEVPSYNPRGVPAPGLKPFQVGSGDPGTLGNFMFGTGELGAPAMPPAPTIPTPQQPATPYVDAGMTALGANRLSPDAAAAVFTGGADIGVPLEQAPKWGGVDFGPASSSDIDRGLTGGPLLTANQMQQDARAQNLINARYPLAGDFDPMAANIDAAASLRKLEDLLPAENQRPTLGEGGAFTVGEGGVIQNVPRSPLTAGEATNFEQLIEKIRAQGQAKAGEYYAKDAAQYRDADQLIKIKYARIMSDIDTLPVPTQQKALLKQKAQGEAEAEMLKLREMGIAGRPKFDPYALPGEQAQHGNP